MRNLINCIHCKIKLLSTRSDVKYCSKKCGDSYYRKLHKKSNIIKCLFCDVIFETFKRSDTKYCSLVCLNNNKKINNSVNKKEYYNKNKEKLKIKSRNNYEKIKNTEKFKIRSSSYRKSWETEKRSKDIIYKLKKQLRIRLNSAIRKNIKVGSAIRDLGCSVEELKSHLESKFQPGMTWENYGFYGWHIDHIIPLSSLDLTNVDNIKKLCHFSNLQPLWAHDNMKKGNKII